MKLVIYGAQSLALGAYKAIRTTYPNKEVACFLVTTMGNNAPVLGGIPVRELSEFISGMSQEEKDDVADTEKKLNEQKSKKSQLIADYAKGNNVLHQLIDLALLQNGMLKGEALGRFVKRSVDMIK